MVSDCYQFLNEPLTTHLNSDQNRQFLSDMGRRYEDWQVNQVDTALRLYDYFLSKNVSPTMGDISSNIEIWKMLEDKMREALRHRHRSLSTEKTYLIRLRNFRNFVNYNPPDQLEGIDLQDFLSKLAVGKKVEKEYDIRVIQELLGHRNLQTTMIYTHVPSKNVLGVKSPLDGWILDLKFPIWLLTSKKIFDSL